MSYLCTMKTQPMDKIAIHTFEEIHHVCLMYGLKKAFCRFPFLARNIMATPPPVRRSPERTRLLLGQKANPVNVQYYKSDILIVYNAEKAAVQEVLSFAKAVIEEYLLLRHPYMKTDWEGDILKESSSGHLIAEIAPLSPETDDRP